MLCKVTLGVLKGASKLNVLLFIYFIICQLLVREMNCDNNLWVVTYELTAPASLWEDVVLVV